MVTQELALTAFHCVGDRTNGTVTSSAVALSDGQDDVQAEVVDFDAGLDIAVLRLLGTMPAGWTQHQLVDKLQPGLRILARGFPHSARGADVRSLGGRVESPWATIMDGIPAIELYSDQAAAGMSLTGLSGSPVSWVDNGEIVGAIGVVRWSPTRDDGTPGDGGTVYATSVASVVARFPQLSPLVLERREAVTKLAPRYVHGVALPKLWADRSAELGQLEASLEDPAVRVLNIVALGGTGKTTLTRRLAENAFSNGEFDSVLWFSFYRDEDVEQFFLEGCRYLIPDFDAFSSPSTFERASLLQSALQRRSSLIVLDGFERMLESPSSPGGLARVVRREMSSFLQFVLGATMQSKVAITSREDVLELSQLDGYRRVDLPDLSPTSAVGYLQDAGLSAPASDLMRLARAYGFHVLALGVLIDYLKLRRSTSDLTSFDAPLSFPPDTPNADRLNRLLGFYWEILVPGQRDILRWVSASPRGLSEAELLDLSVDGPQRQTTDSELLLDLYRLQDSSLVETTVDGDGEERTDAHPLLKGYYYGQMSKADAVGIHQELYRVAAARAVPSEPETIHNIQPLVDMFWHACASGDEMQAFAIWRDSRVRTRLLWWGSYDTALQLISELLESPASRSQLDQAVRGHLLDEMGTLLVKTGQPAEAIKAYLEAVELLVDVPDRRLQALLHLVEAQVEVGLLADARIALDRARHESYRVPEFSMYKLSGREGYLAAAAGDRQQAEDLLGESIELASAVLPESSGIGYVCLFQRVRADNRRLRGDLDGAGEDYRAAQRIAEQPRWRFIDYLGHIERGLGDLSFAQGRSIDAFAHYRVAIDIARRIGYVFLETETHVAEAKAHLSEGSRERASELANAALDLASSGGWVSLECQSRLVLAECALSSGHERQMLIELQLAERLARRIGRSDADGWIADLRLRSDPGDGS